MFHQGPNVLEYQQNHQPEEQRHANQVDDGFLLLRQRLAADVSPAFMFCLEDDGLDVRPLFWGPAGLVDVPVGKSVRYIWKSGAFEKTVSGKPE